MKSFSLASHMFALKSGVSWVAMSLATDAVHQSVKRVTTDKSLFLKA